MNIYIHLCSSRPHKLWYHPFSECRYNGRCVNAGFKTKYLKSKQSCLVRQCRNGLMRVVQQLCITDAGCLPMGNRLSTCKVNGKPATDCVCWNDNGSPMLLLTEGTEINPNNT